MRMAAIAGKVEAELVFCSRATKDQKKHWVEGGVSNPRSNFEEERHEITVTDVSADTFPLRPSLDVNGFAFAALKTAEQDFTDEELITSKYYSEVKDFLLQHCHASEIVIFDHTIRRPGTSRGPIPRTHVDQTEKAAIVRVERHAPNRLPPEAKSRFQLINVWRPISHPAWNNPLALCDYQSLSSGDMIETDRIDFSRLDQPPGETYSVAYNPSQHWYYHKNLKQDQVVLIKCFDSDATKARLCPHTAFSDPTSDPDKPQRESIELRCLVFHD